MKNNRYKYNKSPLVEVIFQLRFPTILSINSIQPYQFQELIREEYPYYDENIEQENELTVAPDLRQAQLKSSQNKNYSFVSVNHEYKVNLTSTFIAVSTLQYSKWEDFKKRIEFVIGCFEKVYKPLFYTRVGLRYTNVIQRSELNLDNTDWSELIQPELLGVISDKKNINSYISEAEFKNVNNDTFTKTHVELIQINDKQEICLLIDCDYFKPEKTDNKEVIDVVGQLHTESSGFLSRTITEKLHKAMKPEII